MGDLEVKRDLLPPSIAPPSTASSASRFLEPPCDIAHAVQIRRQATGSRAIAPMKQRLVSSFPDKSLWIYSGCQDDQTSADATIGGSSQGALSWALNKALDDTNYDVTHENLLNSTRRIVAGKGFKQVPALETTTATNL